jgi:hypothetical protein
MKVIVLVTMLYLCVGIAYAGALVMKMNWSGYDDDDDQ